MPYIRIHIKDLVNPEAPHSITSSCNSPKEDGTFVNEEVCGRENISECHEKESMVNDSMDKDKLDEVSSHGSQQASPIDDKRKLLHLLEAASKKIALADSEMSLANSNSSASVPYGTQCSYVRPAQTTEAQVNAGQPAKQDTTSETIQVKKTRKVRKSTFAEKLMDVLSTKGNEDVITWFPNGNSFTVINKNQFSRDVLPKYFKEAKYQSFVRKLYRWGFRRVADSPKDTAFYHGMFLRDRPDLCRKMRSCNIVVEDDERSRHSILKQKESQARKAPAEFTQDAVADNNTKSSLVDASTPVQLLEFPTKIEEVDSTAQQVPHLDSRLLSYRNGLNLGLKPILKPQIGHTLPFMLSGHGMLSNRFFMNNKHDIMKRSVMGLDQSNLNVALSKRLDEIYCRYS